MNGAGCVRGKEYKNLQRERDELIREGGEKPPSLIIL